MEKQVGDVDGVILKVGDVVEFAGIDNDTKFKDVKFNDDKTEVVIKLDEDGYVEGIGKIVKIDIDNTTSPNPSGRISIECDGRIVSMGSRAFVLKK